MRREIKFRGRRISNKKWVYGSLVISGKNARIFEKWEKSKGHRVYEIDPKSIGQFNGLKDKNGKEIYEGDIMLYSIIHSSTDKKRIGEKQYAYIKWLDKEAKFVQAFNNSDDYEMLDETMKLTEIIGNIFENPELLK